MCRWDSKDFSLLSLRNRKVPVDVVDKSHLRHNVTEVSEARGRDLKRLSIFRLRNTKPVQLLQEENFAKPQLNFVSEFGCRNRRRSLAGNPPLAPLFVIAKFGRATIFAVQL